MSNKFKNLIKKSSNPDLIQAALDFAKESYKERQKVSGENYIQHALRVSLSLSEMNLDINTIIAGLLHDVLDKKIPSLRKLTLKKIKSKFGKEVAFLVDRVAKVSKISLPMTPKTGKETRFEKKKIENLRKMFFAQAQDLRVILIELVSRIDNLKTLNHLPPQKQKIYALETLNIFVPIAERLGIWKIKLNLEDPAFHYLLPEKFNWLKNNIKEKYEEREKYLKSFVPQLKEFLEKEGVKVLDINHRAKSYWSIYQKFLQKDKDLNKIHDLIALRVIVPALKDCYKTLGIIHKHYKPLTNEIDDFIAEPKPNGYQSLHTTVICEKGEITEIQIRTEEIHKKAEYGICAHWAYKQKIDLEREKKEIDWTKEIPKLLKTYKINFFKNRIFVFTPKGDIIDLPRKSTPIDFAYAIHTDIGNHCQAAKVNDKLVSLSTPLKTADTVKIITDKRKEPSRDWLDFVKTNLAKTRIRKHLKKIESPLRKPFLIIKKGISRVLPKRKKPAVKKTVTKETKKGLSQRVSLAGEKGTFKIRRAKCCSPKPGDKIKAYITQNRGASLHKPSCHNFKRLSKKFPDKVIDASWISE